MNDKIIDAEGHFLNLDRPRGDVPVASEIMAGQVQVGGWVSYREHLGWNPRSEFDFTVRTGTMSELGVREGGLVKTIPTHQDG